MCACGQTFELSYIDYDHGETVRASVGDVSSRDWESHVDSLVAVVDAVVVVFIVRAAVVNAPTVQATQVLWPMHHNI